MPQDPFAQYAVPTSRGSDPFAAYAVKERRRPVSAEDFIENREPEGSAVGRFLGGVGEMLNPVTMVKGLATAARHPIDTVTGLVGAQVGEGKKAIDLAKEGRFSEAIGHGGAALLPVLGPIAASIGEEAGQGDIAGAAGKLAGLAAPVAALKIAPKGVRLPGLTKHPNPTAAEAVELATAAGVPVDAATATGNRFVAAAQHIADRTLGGSVIAGKKAQAQAEGLATLGEQLASKGYGTSTTAEQAGEAVRSAVMDNIRAHNRTADAGYNVLRKIEADPASVRPVKMKDGSVQMMPLPVDVQATQAALRPLHQELLRQSRLTPAAMMGDKARALQALDSLMSADAYAPLSVVDSFLGDLKSFARVDIPELRSAGQGAAAEAVKHLDAQVRLTAAKAGPLADAALRTGRTATIAKYGAADVLDSLAAEPVRTINKLTAPKDAAIDQLRAVAKEAPQALPQIGRAVIDDLLGQATAEGGFGHAKGIAAKWEKLGPQTKLLLYKDPGYVRDLDRFFQFAKMAAENPNPSGTAHNILTAGQGALLVTEPVTGVATQLSGAVLSSLLHSKRGVQLLTRGFTLPAKNTAAATAWLSGLNAATTPSGSQMRTAPAR